MHDLKRRNQTLRSKIESLEIQTLDLHYWSLPCDAIDWFGWLIGWLLVALGPTRGIQQWSHGLSLESQMRSGVAHKVFIHSAI